MHVRTTARSDMFMGIVIKATVVNNETGFSRDLGEASYPDDSVENHVRCAETALIHSGMNAVLTGYKTIEASKNSISHYVRVSQ